jgi:hypothetical protein
VYEDKSQEVHNHNRMVSYKLYVRLRFSDKNYVYISRLSCVLYVPPVLSFFTETPSSISYSEVWGSYGGEYEDDRLLGHSAVKIIYLK